jgi:hypothetical protein
MDIWHFLAVVAVDKTCGNRRREARLLFQDEMK